MTAQIHDTVFHGGTSHSLAGVSGSGLFDINTLNFRPEWRSTACRRGYVAHYSIFDNHLYLSRLQIALPRAQQGLANLGGGPVLFGSWPRVDDFTGYVYEDIKESMQFTGGLLMANDFIRGLYVHIDFRPPWKFKRLQEILFESGHVTDVIDRSDEVAEIRDRALAERQGINRSLLSRSDRQITELVERCFSRKYACG